MKPLLSVVLFAAITAAALPVRATIERTVDKSFPVTAAGTLHLTTSGGSLTVMPGPDGVVKITARERIRADSDAEADELLKDLELKFDQSGNDVTASAKYTRERFGFHFGSWPPVQVSFVATVPASYAADLHTSGGGITVGDLAGQVTARTSGGGVKLGKIHGAVDVHTSGGSITLAEAGERTKLDTSGGSITVGHIAGPADISTSGGSIAIESVEQKVRAHTSGGSIRAGITGPLKDDCSLSTSGGGIHVVVDKNASFNLDAETSGGTVNADGLTITLSDANKRRSKLAGAVNGGGPELKLRTSGGSIRVQIR